mgnify:CR=1 FL=1
MRPRTLLPVLTAALLAVTSAGAQAPTYTVSIRATGILPGERHSFVLGSQFLFVGVNDTPVAFATGLPDGASYNVIPGFETRYGETRGCGLKNNYGRISGANVVLTAVCGDPPPTQHSVSVRINTIGVGESITFALAENGSTTPPSLVTVLTAGTVMTFPASIGWKKGFSVSILPGFPRACNPTGATGYIQSDMLMSFDCGAPPAVSATPRDPSRSITTPIRPLLVGPGNPTVAGRAPGAAAPPTGTVAVAGRFHGPVGSRVVLQLNGLGDLPLTIPAVAGVTDVYNTIDFAFATRRPAGSANTVAIKSSPSGQQCRVYDGATAPAGTRVLVGCETVVDQVSRNSAGTVRATFYESFDVVVGGAGEAVGRTADGYGEGRFVAFVSRMAGLAGSTGKHRQIFWRDRLTSDTRMISTGPGGVEGDGQSNAPSISADGLHVAFESAATNLVANDANRVRDVFVWDAENPQTLRRASVGAGGAEANANSYEPSLSGDGSVVAFTTTASNLTPSVEGTTTANVVRRDLSAGTNTLLTRGTKGKAVGGSRPAISEDGNRIAFHTNTDNLVSGDANGLWDIFVYDHTTAQVKRVSLTAGGGERNQGQESASRIVTPAISGDGRFVAYSTTATNVVSGDANGMQDVFVANLETGGVQRASISSTGTESNGDSPILQGEKLTLSYDGTWVAFTSKATNLGAAAANVIIHNNVTGETRAVSTQQGSYISTPSLSRKAAYVAFGGGTPLDPRATSSGMFMRFLGIADSFWWMRQ